MGALFGRWYPRDYLDVDAALTRYTRIQLIELVIERDPGFDLSHFATPSQSSIAYRIARSPGTAFQPMRSPRCANGSPPGGRASRRRSRSRGSRTDALTATDNPPNGPWFRDETGTTGHVTDAAGADRHSAATRTLSVRFTPKD
jgi:hypothetical protein